MSATDEAITAERWAAWDDPHLRQTAIGLNAMLAAQKIAKAGGECCAFGVLARQLDHVLEQVGRVRKAADAPED